jgi:hypothetical protein
LEYFDSKICHSCRKINKTVGFKKLANLRQEICKKTTKIVFITMTVESAESFLAWRGGVVVETVETLF